MSKAPCSICGRRDLTDPCADCQPLTDLQKIAVRNVRMAAEDMCGLRNRTIVALHESRKANVAEIADRVLIRILGETDAN
jgi:hypothetical protein